MELLMTDANFNEIGRVYVSGDFEFGDYNARNDFELTGSALEKGNLLYVDGSEIGGWIAEAQYQNGEKTIYRGYTWYGILTRDQVKSTTSGEARKVNGGEANAWLKSLLNESETMKAWFEVSAANSGITLGTFTFSEADITYLQAINEICQANDCVLEITANKSYVDKKMHLNACIKRATVYDDAYSEESRANMVFTDTDMGVNHAHCTASVNSNDIEFDLYLHPDGTINQTQYYKGRYHSKENLSIGTADSRSEAIKSAKSKMREIIPQKRLELLSGGENHNTGDIIVGRYQSKNFSIETYVSKIIARCDGGNIYLEYELSERTDLSEE